MPGQSRPPRSFTVQGFTILVGRGDTDNDVLTFQIAEPGDVWLHAAGVPGSHVVVRNPDHLPELPRDVVEAAARLAAWYSRARAARGKVEIHVCRAADVGKPPGFAPGEVQLKRWDSLRVYAQPPPASEEPR